LAIFTANLLAESSAQANVEGLPRWLKFAGGVVALVTAIIGVPAAYWVSKKARLETIKLQLDILKAEGKTRKSVNPDAPQTALTREDVIQSPHAVLTGIQDFVIRFIILYVTIAAWGIVDKLLSSFIEVHVNYFLSEHLFRRPSWYWVLAIAFYSHLTVVGDILIFFLLGWPLLSDVARFVGVRPLKLFRKS